MKAHDARVHAFLNRIGYVIGRTLLIMPILLVGALGAFAFFLVLVNIAAWVTGR